MVTPRRGDVVWLSFNPQAGYEQAGCRPAVVLSPQAYNARTGLALLCLVTSQVKGYPFEVAIPDNGRVSGVILADRVKSLDWRARQAEWIISLPIHTVEEVLAKLGALLG